MGLKRAVIVDSLKLSHTLIGLVLILVRIDEICNTLQEKNNCATNFTTWFYHVTVLIPIFSPQGQTVAHQGPPLGRETRHSNPETIRKQGETVKNEW